MPSQESAFPPPGQESLGAQLLEQLRLAVEERCPDASRSLRALKHASPAMQQLTLGIAPAPLQRALIELGVCVRLPAREGGCQLTLLGLAFLAQLPELSEREKQSLRGEAEQALARMDPRVGSPLPPPRRASLFSRWRVWTFRGGRPLR